MLQLYLDPCTVNSRKALAGLKYMNIPFESHHVDYFTGEHKGAEYLKINPCATMPAAVDGELYITESNAILQYAADANGGHPAYPKDLKERAAVNKWLLWEASAWFPSCYIYLVEYVVKPLLNTTPDEEVIKGAAPRFHQLATILNDQLKKTKYLAGDVLTIADIAVASGMHLWEDCQLPLDQYPELKSWMINLIEKIPAWENTQGAVEKALLPNKKPKETNGTAATVETSFNYTKDVAPKNTELYFYDSDQSQGIHEPGDDPRTATVTDGWSRVDSFTADRNGFSLHPFHTTHSDWQDEEAVRNKFYPEIVEFIKKTTGANRVLVFDHTIRTKVNQAKALTQETNTSQRSPVTLVHCDYTAESGPLRVKQLLPEDAEDLLSRRVAFFNVWKPIHNPVEEYPLAMCDVESAPQSDFFKLYLRYRDRVGENYVMKHNPNHKWYYFPNMNTEQVVLLKTYDSDTNRARFVGHSAFVDPTSKPDAPTRESVEIRTMAFF